MKVGDLVKYYGSWCHVGIVLEINDAGGTVKVFRQHEGDKKWWVTSGCEVMNESRCDVICFNI